MTPIEIPWKTYCYYKNCLSPRDRRIYEAIFSGVQCFAPQIPLPVDCTPDEALRIYSFLRRDFPLFFHLSHSIKVSTGPGTVIYPQCLMDQAEYLRLHNKVKDFVLASVQTLSGLQEYKRVKSIHNSIARHVIYHGIEEENSHNVLGAILYRRAVCESIAMAFKLICDGNHIPCIVVVGHASSTDGKNFGTVADDGSENHAWNRVRLGNTWYNVDVTFDLGAEDPKDTGSIKYGYFCRSDAVFSRNHTPSYPNLPACPEDHSYYRATGKYVTGEAELRRMIARHIKERKEHFAFEYSADSGLDSEHIQRLLSQELSFSPYQSAAVQCRDALRIVSVTLNTEPQKA